MIFDAHADILTFLAQNGAEEFRKTQLPLYKKAGISHSIFVNYTEPVSVNPVEEFNYINNRALHELEKLDDVIKICKTSEDFTKSSDKINIILGIEGLCGLSEISELDTLYNRGFRHASLTWNDENIYATGCAGNSNNGLSKKGREVLDFMQSNKMIIDLAHTNKRTFYDMMDIIKTPPLFSHGACSSLNDIPRNLDDEQLKTLKEHGGLFGISTVGFFLDKDKSKQNVSRLCEHIDHAVSLMGIDKVCFGFDFCYYLYENQPENDMVDIKNIGDIELIFDELSRRGYDCDSLTKLKSQNFSNFINKVLK